MCFFGKVAREAGLTTDSAMRRQVIDANGESKGGPMRIALIAFHFAEYISRLALALAREHPVLLLLGVQNAEADLLPSLRDQVSAACEVHFIPHRRLTDLSLALTVARTVRMVDAFHPDVLHIQENLDHDFFWPVWILNRRVPTVMTMHDPVAHSGLDADYARRLYPRIYSKILRRRADRLIVHGERIREQFLAVNRCPASRVQSVMHGALGDPAAVQVPEPFGSTLLFFGRVETYKGLGVLLDALDLLRDEPQPVRLIIAGRGSELQRYRDRIAYDPRIELLDRFINASEVTPLFLRSTVVVLPYLDASQSGVAALAASYHRPVIASAVGGLPDMVHDGESGILVPPSDPVALAAAIRRVCSDPAFLRQLAAGAGARATGELSWRNIAQATAAVYRAAIAARAGESAPLPS